MTIKLLQVLQECNIQDLSIFGIKASGAYRDKVVLPCYNTLLPAIRQTFGVLLIFQQDSIPQDDER